MARMGPPLKHTLRRMLPFRRRPHPTLQVAEVVAPGGAVNPTVYRAPAPPAGGEGGKGGACCGGGSH